MDSGATPGSISSMPLDQEKPALWEAERLGVAYDEASLEEGPRRRGTKSAVSAFRRGIWLTFLEISFVVLGFYGLLKQGGVVDTATRWLAHPKVIPEEPFRVIGHTFQVKQPRSNIPTSSNQTRMYKRLLLECTT